MEQERITTAQLLDTIPEVVHLLRRGTRTYATLERVAKTAVRESGFVEGGEGEALGEFGHLVFPYREMGAIDTLDLFGLDELILFSFYAMNRSKYNSVADLGANCGLHSILMARLGWQVEAYEPDPQHVAVFRRNLILNGIDGVAIHQQAVSDRTGRCEFTRVVGNTTGSHISGSKRDPYGDLERFTVESVDIRDIMASVDFVKMDVEGQEAVTIQATGTSDWLGTDAMLEVGTPGNAEAIFAHLSSIGIKMFPQRTGWVEARSAGDLPNHHSQGSLFVSASRRPAWRPVEGGEACQM